MNHRMKHREKFWSGQDKGSYNCPDCDRGIEEVSEFQVHHKDGDQTNGDMENLVGLCRECHHDRHGDWIRDYEPQGIRERDRKYMGVL